MPGKRIAREKLTIKKMIALYESQCPQASAVQGHCTPTRKNVLINAYLARKNPPVSSARCTAISRLNARR